MAGGGEVEPAGAGTASAGVASSVAGELWRGDGRREGRREGVEEEGGGEERGRKDTNSVCLHCVHVVITVSSLPHDPYCIIISEFLKKQITVEPL